MLSWAPSTAQPAFGPVGALMGYDFHLTPNGARLIEVNTNAGGAFLNAILARAQRACCAGPLAQLDVGSTENFGDRVAEMFISEWRRQRGSGRPGTIAIVDDQPEQQHLYPEFRLAKALLDSHGFNALIIDPNELVATENALVLRNEPVDLVYNRLVDFGLDEPRHAALRTAYLAGNVVVTPSPRIHALLADKRNLTLLSDSSRLHEWGLPQNAIDLLSDAVPKTVIVSGANAEILWRDRKSLFFKPARGHGSKAAYRGDKITRRVWEEIVAGAYVAQTFAAPGQRAVEHGGGRAGMKVDVRLYTYAGEVLLAAARIYQGQTTNMRTPGGGFAPVLEVRS